MLVDEFFHQPINHDTILVCKSRKRSTNPLSPHYHLSPAILQSICIVWIDTTIAIILVAARMYVRHVVVGKVRIKDWLMATTLVGLTRVTELVNLKTDRYTYNQHHDTVMNTVIVSWGLDRHLPFPRSGPYCRIHQVGSFSQTACSQSATFEAPIRCISLTFHIVSSAQVPTDSSIY